MIGIVVALKSEASALLNELSQLKEFKIADKPAFSGRLCDKDVILIISGIGKVSAGLSTQMLIDKYSPDFILNFGTCGGINNSVEVLKYYAIDKCCQFDFDLTKLEDVPLGYIQEYDTVFFSTRTKGLDFLPKSVLATADRFTSEKSDIDTVNQIGASLCDMEGGAIAQVCTSNSVPAVLIKGISDVTGSGTHQDQFLKNLKAVGEGFPEIIKKVIIAVSDSL